MNDTDVDELSGAELAHKYLVTYGLATLGNPKGPFAFYQQSKNALRVVGGSQEHVEFGSFETDLAYVPLQEAKRLGASFSVVNSEVVCCIGSVTASGSTYSEAAMRATVVWLSTIKSQTA